MMGCLADIVLSRSLGKEKTATEEQRGCRGIGRAFRLVALDPRHLFGQTKNQLGPLLEVRWGKIEDTIIPG